MIAEDSEARQQRMEEERILDPYGQHHEVAQRGPERYGVGCVAAVAAGLFGGGPRPSASWWLQYPAVALQPSEGCLQFITREAEHAGLLLAPKTFADQSIHAVAYLPSMALGEHTMTFDTTLGSGVIKNSVHANPAGCCRCCCADGLALLFRRGPGGASAHIRGWQAQWGARPAK